MRARSRDRPARSREGACREHGNRSYRSQPFTFKRICDRQCRRSNGQRRRRDGCKADAGVKIVSVRQMREIEQASVRAGVSLDDLMENAGLAIAEALRDRLPSPGSGPALVLVGPGNNGGDGLVAARHLAARGVAVTAYLFLARASEDEKRDLAVDAGVEIVHAFEDADRSKLAAAAAEAGVIVDAVLGTGRARPIEPPLSELFAVIREHAHAQIVAVDLPTGMATDTGHMDPNGLEASEILVLGRPKIGLFLEPTGAPWRFLDIGIPDGLDTRISTELMTSDSMAGIMPARPARSNKGTYGRALIVAGSESYVGAAYLAAAAAGRAGAGGRNNGPSYAENGRRHRHRRPPGRGPEAEDGARRRRARRLSAAPFHP